MTPLASNRLHALYVGALGPLWAGCASTPLWAEGAWWTQPDYRVLGPAVAVFALGMLVRVLRRRSP